jgi:hypothetical protein
MEGVGMAVKRAMDTGSDYLVAVEPKHDPRKILGSLAKSRLTIFGEIKSGVMAGAGAEYCFVGLVLSNGAPHVGA